MLSLLCELRIYCTLVVQCHRLISIFMFEETVNGSQYMTPPNAGKLLTFNAELASSMNLLLLRNSQKSQQAVDPRSLSYRYYHQ
jgi:hypothetical protein